MEYWVFVCGAAFPVTVVVVYRPHWGIQKLLFRLRQNCFVICVLAVLSISYSQDAEHGLVLPERGIKGYTVLGHHWRLVASAGIVSSPCWRGTERM